MPIDDALFEGNDGVVGDGDVFGANLGAALGDVAQTDTELLTQHVSAVAIVERMHFEAGDAHKEARPAESVLLLVVAQHVADVLAEEALDALAELLDPIGLLLRELPIRAGTGLEGRDLLVDLEVPRDV